jgi:hypothetical protein
LQQGTAVRDLPMRFRLRAGTPLHGVHSEMCPLGSRLYRPYAENIRARASATASSMVMKTAPAAASFVTKSSSASMR